MKRILITLAAAVLCAGIASAQDMAKATAAAQAANEALSSGDNALALSGFKEALSLAKECGEEGAELVSTCKGVIPQIVLSIAKGQLRDGEYDAALQSLADAQAAAKEYEVEDVADEAAGLVGQAYLAKGGALIKAKDAAGAAEAFQKALDLDPANGKAALLLGQALAGSGKVDEAVAAFTTAAENGQEDAAKKQLSNLFVKKAQSELKANKLKEAIADCAKSNEYLENANACKIAASAATKLGDNKTAIANYEKYLELAPDAKDAAAITFSVGALYQKSGDNAKAKAYYQKVVNDPQYGAQAKQLAESLK